MSSQMELELYSNSDINFNRHWIERIILDIGDAFEIRVLWKKDTLLLAGALAVAGGLFGGYVGGRMGAVIGAGVGGTSAFVMVTLRDIWDVVKEKLCELSFIVFNYLRRLDPMDYARAFDILMACTTSRRELVFTIVDFIAHKLGHEVFSSITAA